MELAVNPVLYGCFGLAPSQATVLVFLVDVFHSILHHTWNGRDPKRPDETTQGQDQKKQREEGR